MMNQIKIEKRKDGKEKLAILLVVNISYSESFSLKICI